MKSVPLNTTLMDFWRMPEVDMSFSGLQLHHHVAMKKVMAKNLLGNFGLKRFLNS